MSKFVTEVQNHIQEQSMDQNVLDVRSPLPFILELLSKSSKAFLTVWHSFDYILTG